jgi:exonuclease III
LPERKLGVIALLYPVVNEEAFEIDRPILDSDCSEISQFNAQASGTFSEKASYILQRLGSLLKAPIFYLTEKSIRLFGPIRPNQFDQGTKKEEYLGRSLVVALLILAMLPAPGAASVGVACTLGAIAAAGLLGCTLKLVAHYIDRRDFLHLQVGNPKIFSGDKLSVISANICAFEAGLAYVCGGLVPFRARVDRLVQALTQNESCPKGPDVVILQEVWSQGAASSLIERLSRLGYCEFYFSIGDGCISPGSALFIASRHQLQNPSFKCFEGTRTFDMQRGFFSVELPNQSAMNKSIRLITAHPAPSKDDLNPKTEDKELRRAQLKELFRSIHKNERVILAGDFNMTPDELKPLLTEVAQDLAIQPGELKGVTCTQNLSYAYANEPQVKDTRFDYIMTQALDRDGAYEQIIPLYESEDGEDNARGVNTQTALSDHHAVALTIKV